METRVARFGLDGKPEGMDVLTLELECAPAAASETLRYTCLRFTLQHGDGPERGIPALQGWTYAFAESGYDERGQVFGIDHAKFEGLADSTGTILPAEETYFVYNSFIDFHAICDAFAQPVEGGKGVQSLTKIGQRIVHVAAFTKGPVNLGSSVAEGSYFQNGEITLELKGLSEVDGKPCALLGYDSGESAFEMIVTPMPDLEVHTVGRSHYWGDIYKNLATGWVEKADLTEAVVSETTLPMPPSKIDGYIERRITIRNLTQAK
jgi:hypothetical protein